MKRERFYRGLSALAVVGEPRLGGHLILMHTDDGTLIIEYTGISFNVWRRRLTHEGHIHGTPGFQKWGPQKFHDFATDHGIRKMDFIPLFYYDGGDAGGLDALESATMLLEGCVGRSVISANASIAAMSATPSDAGCSIDRSQVDYHAGNRQLSVMREPIELHPNCDFCDETFESPLRSPPGRRQQHLRQALPPQQQILPGQGRPGRRFAI